LASAASEALLGDAVAAEAGAASERMSARVANTATVNLRVSGGSSVRQLTGWNPGRSLPVCTVIPSKSPLLASIDVAFGIRDER
jgi:hypothetical protein